MDTEPVRERFAALAPYLDERLRRLVAAAEAKALGRGGAAAVARATGVSRRAIALGLKELQEAPAVAPERVRRPGGGRKRLVDIDAALQRDLEALLAPYSRGDPQSPLRWTCKSVRQLAAELQGQGHGISHTVVAELLQQMGYSLQGNRKTLEGSAHPDRNGQFEHINQRVEAAQAGGQPVISVDTKKKELVGDFKNSGREWRPKGQPEAVRVHDFVIPELGRAAPYGVYDLTDNTGWVNVGIDHDTAAFAVESIRRWWLAMGRPRYPAATQLLITADGGGSNGYRVRLWKQQLQELANQTGLAISVCHFPPGPSKWNKIEHRLFSFITQNWRGKPLVSHEVIVQLIAATRTATGLQVRCELDTNTYPQGVKVPDQEMAQLNLTRDEFHGEWNYTLAPNSVPHETVIS